MKHELTSMSKKKHTDNDLALSGPQMLCASSIHIIYNNHE